MYQWWVNFIFPSPTNPRKYFNEQKLKELSLSISKVGIIQPITLREQPGKPGRYEIVCGERRYRAALLIKEAEVPAEIKKLTDDEVQELQFIENIEREDVHAMDEAVTFKAMQDNKKRPWSLEDIAGKINKPVSYVVQRLQLNHLVPALQKHFWDEKFLVGHAIMFSRLTKEDQTECSKSNALIRGGEYQGIKQTQEYIERNIMRQLSAAPFKRDDATLVPAAGPCSTCSKRSGCNKLLFNDIKEDDRCFDKKCFEQKKEAWLTAEVDKVLSTKPEILLIHYGYQSTKVPGAISKLATGYKVHILDYSKDEVSQHKADNKYIAFKALYVSGPNAGMYKTVYRKMAGKAAAAAKAASGEKITAADVAAQIESVKERCARGAELDYQKVQEAIIDELNKYPDNELLHRDFPEEIRSVFISFFMYRKLTYCNDEILKKTGLIENDEEDFHKTPQVLMQRLQNITQVQQDTLLMHAMIDAFKASKNYGPDTLIMRELANFVGVDVEGIANAQDAIKIKRETNAQKRISELQQQLKVLSQKKEFKSYANKIASGANKIASGANKSASGSNKSESKIKKLVA